MLEKTKTIKDNKKKTALGAPGLDTWTPGSLPLETGSFVWNCPFPFYFPISCCFPDLCQTLLLLLQVDRNALMDVWFRRSLKYLRLRRFVFKYTSTSTKKMKGNGTTTKRHKPLGIKVWMPSIVVGIAAVKAAVEVESNVPSAYTLARLSDGDWRIWYTFLAELGLMHFELINYSPSMMTASAIYAAHYTMNRNNDL